MACLKKTRFGDEIFQLCCFLAKLNNNSVDFVEVEMMKEKFSKLLLGEDMSGGGKGVCSALAISNAIINLSGNWNHCILFNILLLNHTQNTTLFYFNQRLSIETFLLGFGRKKHILIPYGYTVLFAYSFCIWRAMET